MLSWLTGSKMVDSTRDLEDEARIDDTQFEVPETPAPVFAVRAFKHAIFGTPQPPPTVAPTRATRSKTECENTIPAIAVSKESLTTVQVVDTTNLGLSPTKRGILLTPGTVRGRKKEVAFGSQVVDNEGKRKSRSGIPNSCPGKFPSPWTPKKVEIPEEQAPKEEEKQPKAEGKKPKTSLTDRLCDAKPTGTSPRKVKVRARDDADITIDMMEPRSESGRYWKEQYQSYSQKSEEETKKLIAKQKLARDYARKKDDEANELRRTLEADRKKRHKREQSLEIQVKDLREQLRQALAENARTSAEIAVLRKQAEVATVSKKQRLQMVSATDQNQIAFTKLPLSTQVPISTKMSTTLRSKSPELPDSIWSGAAGAGEDDNSRSFFPLLETSMVPSRSRGEPARTRGHRERRTHRKSSTIMRQDSVVVAEDAPSKSQTLTRTPTPRPGSLISTPTRRTLGERDMNSFISPPPPNLPSPTDLENLAPSPARRLKTTGDIEKARQEMFAYDFSAPLDALRLQAEQPITPQPPVKETVPGEKAIATPEPSSRKHKRLEAKLDLPSDRVEAAKARLAAKKRQKENSRVS